MHLPEEKCQNQIELERIFSEHIFGLSLLETKSKLEMEINHLNPENDNAMVVLSERRGWKGKLEQHFQHADDNKQILYGKCECDLSADEGDTQTDINVHWRQAGK